jgi:hypothetical protein
MYLSEAALLVSLSGLYLLFVAALLWLVFPKS